MDIILAQPNTSQICYC